jgi:hypothetical protein
MQTTPRTGQRTAKRAIPLLCAAGAFGLIGVLVTLLGLAVLTGLLPWDVKGRLLTGNALALFSGAVLVVGVVGLLAAWGLYRGAAWSGFLSIAFWILVGGVALVADRAVPGPGEPLALYLIELMLIPGVVTALVLYGIPSVRAHWRGDTREPLVPESAPEQEPRDDG